MGAAAQREDFITPFNDATGRRQLANALRAAASGKALELIVPIGNYGDLARNEDDYRMLLGFHRLRRYRRRGRRRRRGLTGHRRATQGGRPFVREISFP